MAMFCRHNRLTANCPICKKEMAEELKASLPPTGSKRPARAASAPRRPASQRAGAVVTKRLARAADDGYRSDLVPGIKATADAERLAQALTQATARLEFPGPHPAVAEEDDREEATWLAFLLVLVGPELEEAIVAARPRWADGEVPDVPGDRAATAAAYRAWAERNGGQERAFQGEPGWSAERRFGRVLERLALPGFPRASRFELLVTLNSAGAYDLRADGLHVNVKEDDATSLAAKRALVSGDVMLLERRARELAAASQVPLDALDRGLAWWDSTVELTGEASPAARAALGLPHDG
jgi:hypothetical protein